MIPALTLAAAALLAILSVKQQPLKKDTIQMVGIVVQHDCPLVQSLGCPFVNEPSPSNTMACYCAKTTQQQPTVYPCDPIRLKEQDKALFCWENRARGHHPDWPESRYLILFSKKFFPPFDFPNEIKTDPRCNYALYKTQKLEQRHQRKQETPTKTVPPKQNYTKSYR